MISPVDDTITAQASARGSAYRGIVRVSGPEAVAALRRWFRVRVDDYSQNASVGDETFPAAFRPFEPGERPRIANGELTVWGDELPVPCTLYYWPEGRGFTGQQAVELHTIGSQPLLDAVVRTLCESGCRLAGPGEFTLRAFLAGRIDLPQAEAVLGIIDADDRKQLDVALRQLAGGVGRPLASLRERLLEMTCHLEAEFDFADEEIEFLDRGLLRQELEASLRLIERTERQMQQRGTSFERPRVVLIGRPNAGKSSLFNAMVKRAVPQSRDAAIVSPQPGTTRDWLEAELQIGDLQLTLLDTAGMEAVETIDENDLPRQLAQALTRDAIEQADLVLLCLESGETEAGAITESERLFLRDNADRALIIRTKRDLRGAGVLRNMSNAVSPETSEIITSAETGEGLPRLFDAIQTRLHRDHTHGEVVPATALRCRESLRHAAESLRNALQLTETLRDDFLVATEMRVALEHIGQMTGAVHNDEILDRVFSRFCIGK